MRKLPLAMFALLFITLLAACAHAPGAQEETRTAEYSHRYANMALDLPLDWEYSIREATKDDGNSTFGIEFWPQDDPSLKVSLLYHPSGIGLCGTGVTFKDIKLKNGLTATKCTEGFEDGTWFYLIYHDVPGDYSAECVPSKQQWEEYGDAIMSILGSARLGENVLSQAQAIEIAKAQCTIASDTARAHFNYFAGFWEVRLSAAGDARETQTIWVDFEGNIVDAVRRD